MSFTWGAEAGVVLAPGVRGLIRVLGGPGTGKSSLLVDAAVAQIGAGVEPESVLLLTGSGRLGVRAARQGEAGLPRAGVPGAPGPMGPGSRWSAPCTATPTRCCGGPPSAPV